jgi:hypothetical protein
MWYERKAAWAGFGSGIIRQGNQVSRYRPNPRPRGHMLGRVSVASRNGRTRHGIVRLWVYLLASESIYTHEHRTQGLTPAKPAPVR